MSEANLQYEELPVTRADWEAVKYQKFGYFFTKHGFGNAYETGRKKEDLVNIALVNMAKIHQRKKEEEYNNYKDESQPKPLTIEVLQDNVERITKLIRSAPSVKQKAALLEKRKTISIQLEEMLQIEEGLRLQAELEAEEVDSKTDLKKEDSKTDLKKEG